MLLTRFMRDALRNRLDMPLLNFALMAARALPALDDDDDRLKVVDLPDLIEFLSEDASQLQEEEEERWKAHNGIPKQDLSMGRHRSGPTEAFTRATGRRRRVL